MTLVLLRLLLMSLRGRVLRSVRMLRKPKYLLGSVIGVGWLLFWVGRSAGGVRIGNFVRFGGSDVSFAPETAAGLQVVAALGLALVASVSWLSPWGKLGLGLKEAELHLLLPAPIGRRQMIQYAILKNQVGLVITAAILSLFTGGGTPLARWLWFGGIWATFNVWDLNAKLRGTFLVRQREVSTGSARMRRGLLVLAILAFWAVAGPVFLEACGAAWGVMRGAGFEGAARGVEAFRSVAAGSTALGVLLTPFAWAVGPLFAQGLSGFFLALLPAAGLYVVQHELIVRSPARFEEPSLLHAEEESRAKSPTKAFARMSERARQRAPFALQALGPPEVAIVWKNLLSALRWPLYRVATGAAGVMAVIALALPLVGTPTPVFGLLAFLGTLGMVLYPFMGGIVWENDFRGELRYIELVRTWPIGADRFVLAEVLSPALLGAIAALLGAGLFLSALAGASFAEALADRRFTLLPKPGTAILGVRYEGALLLILLGAVPLAAGVSAISAALQNLIVLFVPAWLAEGGDPLKGVAAFGHRLLFASALGLAFFFVMIPSTLLVLVAVALQWLIGVPWSAWLFPIWGALAATPLFVGAAFILRAAAALWQDLDPAEELLESGN